MAEGAPFAGNRRSVNVPGMGKVNQTWLWAGAAAVAGIVIYAYMRRSREAPAPGEGEVTAGDEWSPDAYTGAGTPAPGGETYDPNAVVSRFIAPVTNAEWTQRVVEYLSSLDYNPNFVSETIGKYLSGNALTAAEKLLVQSGIAGMGNPPAGALPILSAPEPTTPQQPAKPRVLTGWHGHRMNQTQSWKSVARYYANFPDKADSVEVTLRGIAAANPVTYKADNVNAHKGWIVLVPFPTTRRVSGTSP